MNNGGNIEYRYLDGGVFGPLSAEGTVLCHREEFEQRNHATLLSGFIKLSRPTQGSLSFHWMLWRFLWARAAIPDSDRSVGGQGAGIRSGTTLIGVDTLQLLAVSVMFSGYEYPEGAVYAPMIDARRMEVFTGVYDRGSDTIAGPAPMILDADSYAGFLEKSTVLFFGNGSDKARGVVTSPNAVFVA